MPRQNSRQPATGQRTPEEIRLTDELNGLYRDSGYPSRRDLSRDMPGGYGASTIGDALKGLGLPGWDVFESLVTHLGGDTAKFLGLYQEARLARNAARGIAARADLILLCAVHPEGTPAPTAITVHKGEAMCAACYAASD